MLRAVGIDCLGSSRKDVAAASGEELNGEVILILRGELGNPFSLPEGMLKGFDVDWYRVTDPCVLLEIVGVVAERERPNLLCEVPYFCRIAPNPGRRTSVDSFLRVAL
jgi:hypothetical protein